MPFTISYFKYTQGRGLIGMYSEGLPLRIYLIRAKMDGCRVTSTDFLCRQMKIFSKSFTIVLGVQSPYLNPKLPFWDLFRCQLYKHGSKWMAAQLLVHFFCHQNENIFSKFVDRYGDQNHNLLAQNCHFWIFLVANCTKIVKMDGSTAAGTLFHCP